jgi:hypothetical protein
MQINHDIAPHHAADEGDGLQILKVTVESYLCLP